MTVVGLRQLAMPALRSSGTNVIGALTVLAMAASEPDPR